MNDGSDGRTPSGWMRALGMIGAVFMIGYGTRGLVRNDLHVSLSKSSDPGVHLHGALAWLCFAGMVTMAIGLWRLLAPEFGNGEFDFDARRRKFGPIFVIGLGLYVAAQAIAGLRS